MILWIDPAHHDSFTIIFVAGEQNQVPNQLRGGVSFVRYSSIDDLGQFAV